MNIVVVQRPRNGIADGVSQGPGVGNLTGGGTSVVPAFWWKQSP